MNLTLADKTFRPLLSKEAVESKVSYVATQLNQTYTALGEDRGIKPILLVVLNGAVPFAMDLIKKLVFDFDLDFVKVSSYQGKTTRVNSLSMAISGPELDLKGREVILIEDIVDTGHTVSNLTERLIKAGAYWVTIATLLFKPDAYRYDYRPRYVGSSIDNKFVVGYGMDYKGLGRGLREIYQLVE